MRSSFPPGIGSTGFRRLWARHDVREGVHGAKTFQHPRVGDIAVEWDAYPLQPHGLDPVVTLVAENDSGPRSLPDAPGDQGPGSNRTRRLTPRRRSGRPGS
ncbi:MmyB family transcriptional regulator [Streptosporangium sp. OZ121]|uniref:MmyB family transcriptional regulator n=1 Tax=Streptosporangium sp. OZ121 TaxID=3444183 RepID=UPI003F7A679E